MTTPRLRLDTLHGLAQVCAFNNACFTALGRPFNRMSSLNRTFEGGFLRCGNCGGLRRMRVEIVWTPTRDADEADRALKLDSESYEEDQPAFWDDVVRQLMPSVFLAECLQACGAIFTLDLHDGPSGPALAVLPNHLGGLST